MAVTVLAPLTAEQWEVIDCAWLEGDPAWRIAKRECLSYKQIRKTLELLGHTFEQRSKSCNAPDPIWDKARKAKYDRDRITAFKQAVLNHYGARCACCSEDTIGFLTLDHVYGGGGKDRRSIKQASMWEAVVKRGFPDSFRILCWNCNSGSYYNGGICPHELPAWTGLTQGV